MFDPKLYREACDRMTLDAEKIEEMIMMTENTSKKPFGRPARVALVAAALTAALGITAAAAENPAVQEFFTTIFVTVRTNDGGAGLNIPTVAVQEQDGRTILLVNGEEADVTDALAQSKEYLYEGDGFQVVVDENGVAVITAYGTDGTVVSFSTEGESGDRVVYEVTTDMEEEGTVTVTAADTPDVDWGLFHVTTDQNGTVVVKEAGEE